MNMGVQEIDLRRLVIKSFHMTDVQMGEEKKITMDGKLKIDGSYIEKIQSYILEIYLNLRLITNIKFQ